MEKPLTSFIWLLLIFHQIVLSKDLMPFNQRFKTVSGVAPAFGDSKTVTVIPGTGSFIDDLPRDVITLGVDQTYPDYFGTAMAVKVRLILKPLNPNQASYPIYLQINYHPFDTITYRDQHAYSFLSSYQFKVTIDTIYINGVSQTSLPKNLYIDASIYVTRWYNFSNTSPTLSIDPKKSDCDTHDQELLISWAGTPDAEEYQLEWTFVNDYTDTTTFISSDNLAFNFKTNATRITTYNSNYNIPLLFEHGYLLCRVRAIGRALNVPHQILYGDWSVVDKGMVSDFPDANYHVTHPHKDTVNWQLTTTFAEEGKKKEVISYFDGSLRNRETVTKLNTDSNLIVGQTIYDFQGRPAINVLPVPTGDRCLTQAGMQGYINYITQFNKNGNGSEYRNENFDKDTVSACKVLASPMNAVSGSSLYYSPGNPNKTGFQAFVPDAALFPFTQTEYTPDNIGRIRRQGGVGPGFQLGSTHETFYYYGKPQQLEIDRLFGSEAGDASHYQKNMVRDPNGQTSVSYLDQEGRVIATSLSGDTVPGLIGLPSEDNANIQLTSDLYNKDADGNTILNTINISQNSIEFNSQLLVGYASNYSFDYNLVIDTLFDPCLEGNICFNCVYNLEIKVTDECGLNTILDIDTVGHFSTDSSGNLTFLFQCANPTALTLTKPFNLLLQPGNYAVSKILTVNQEAKNAFIAAYLDTAYNKCLLTLQDFIDPALANLDTSSCYITCENCVQSLGSRDSFVALGYGSALKYDYLAEQCKKPCKSQSLCDMSYQMMLADVSKNGQYGMHQNLYGQTDTLISPLSVFNINNELPKKDTANWRHPLMTIFGSSYHSYIEGDGELSVIPLSDSAGIYIPRVANTSLIYYSAPGGFHYTYPENLKYATDFLDHWQSTWALSLVQYHPEYCYYLSCSEYSNPVNNSPISSNDFDDLLRSADTYAQAVTYQLITSGTTPLSRVYNGWDHAIAPVWDPFTVTGNYDGDGIDLHNRMLSYTTVNNLPIDMVSFASYQARCGGVGAVTTACSNFGGTFGTALQTTAMRDTEWAILKGLYLSLKAQLQYERANAYALSICAGYNGCIGESPWSPYGTAMAGATCPSCPYYDANQPCSIETYQLYSGKIKRFIDDSKSDLMPTTIQEVAYQCYLATGECPNALNFQALLNDLAAANKLKSTAAVTLTNYSSFTGLYSSIYDFNPPLPPPDWKWTGSAGNILNFTIKPIGGSLYTGHLDKTGLGISSWTNVKVMKELHVTGYSNGISSFTVLAGVAAPPGSLNPYTYHLVHGTINLDLGTCQFAEICQPNEFAIHLSMLMSQLASQNKLTSSTIVPLHNTTYKPFVSQSILNAIGVTSASHLRWIYKSPHHFELVDSLTADSVVIQITSSEPSLFNYAMLSNVKYVANITSNSYNAFTMDAYDSSDNLLVKLSGQVIKYQSGSPSQIVMGDCSLPVPIQCENPVYETTTQFFNVITDLLVNHDISTSQNIFANPYMTATLSNLFNASGPSISDYEMDTIGSLFQDSMLFTRMCPLVISHSNTLNPALFMNNITSINEIKLTGTSDGMGNYHDFFLIAKFGPTNTLDTVFGSACIPLRLCDCDEAFTLPGKGEVDRKNNLREGDDSIETWDSAFDSVQVAIDSSYNTYSAELDSLYEQINVGQTDSGYVEPLNENQFYAGGFIYSMNTYTRYLEHFQAEIDSIDHITNPAAFVLWYGNYVEVDKEYQRYLAAVNRYNNICLLYGLATMTAVNDTDFYNNFYADSIFAYIDYLSDYPQDTVAALDVSAYRLVQGYRPPDSICALLYHQYVEAYLQFRSRQLANETCSQWHIIAPFYSYQNFLNNNLCCSDSGIIMTTQYIEVLNDTAQCPEPLPVMDECGNEAARMSINTLSCQEAYQNYVNLINTYNSSYYAAATGQFLEIIYVTYDAFSSEALCACYPGYSQYLSSYLTTTDIQIIRPQNISEFCLPTPVTPCEIDYAQYISVSMAYADTILSNDLDLPMINQTYSPAYFEQGGYCNCTNAFESFLNAILSGAIPNSEGLGAEVNNFFVTCQATLIPKCAEDVIIDTLYNVPFPTQDDPCVVQLINTAIYNATNAYEEYRDSITSFISNKYVSHCLDAFESLDATYQFKEYHFTLYYYDMAGNLIKTVPPEGIEPLGVTSSYDALEQKIISDRTNNTHTVFTSHTLVTLYEYNSLNQLIRQSLPDQDKMNIFESVVPGGINADLQVTAIQFVSESKGFLSGYLDGGSGIKRGAFYTTTDGGFNWQLSTTVAGSDLKKIFWATKDTGYAVGSEGTLIKTVDAGQNWSLLNTYVTPAGDTCIYDFNDLYFFNNNLGYIAGKNGRIIKTIDGGTTFTSVSIGQGRKDECTSVTANGNFIYFTLTEHYTGIYPSTASRILYLNKNSGASGSATLHPINPYRIRYYGKGKAYAVGINGSLSKRVKIGVSYYWIGVGTKLKRDFRDIDFISDSVGIALVDSNEAGGVVYGQIYSTIDGGINWKLLSDTGKYYTSWYVFNTSAAIHKAVAVGWHGEVLKISYFPSNDFGLIKLERVSDVTTSAKLTSVWAVEHGNKLYVVTGGNNARMYFNSNANYLSSAWISSTITAGEPLYIKARDFYTGGTWDISGVIVASPSIAYGFMVNPASHVLLTPVSLSYPVIKSIIYAEMDPVKNRVMMYDGINNKFSFAIPVSGTAPSTETTITTLNTFSGFTPPVYYFDVNDDTLVGSTFGNNSGDLVLGKINTSASTVTISNESPNYRCPVLADIQQGFSNIFAVGNSGTFLTSTTTNKFSSVICKNIRNLNAVKLKNGTDGYVVSDSGGIYSFHYTFSGFNSNLIPVDITQQDDLLDLAIYNSSVIYAVGRKGTMLYSANGIAPFTKMLNTNLVDLHGVIIRPTTSNAWIAGDKNQLFLAVNGSQLQVSNVYLQTIRAFHFTDQQNGYLVSDNFNIRQTHDGGNTWNIVTPLVSLTSYPTLVCLKSLNPSLSIAAGNARRYVEITDRKAAVSTFNMPVPVPNNAATNILGLGISSITGDIKYMIVRNTTNASGYFLTKAGPWSVDTTYANSSYPKSLWVFRNDNVILAGTNSLLCFYDGVHTHNVYPTGNNFPANTTLNTVAFYDDINGYAAGEKGVIIKSKDWGFTFNPELKILYTSPATWELKPINDNLVNQVVTNNMTINALGVPGRFSVMPGGFYSPVGSAHIGYSRIIHDESIIYSTRFWYDRIGRMVLSQNTKQFNQSLKQYSYSLYDPLGRIVESGVKRENSSPTFASIFGTFVGSDYNVNVIDDPKLSLWLNTASNSTRFEVTHSFYDAAIAALPGSFVQENLRKRIATVTYQDTFKSNILTYKYASHYSYDIHGNVKTIFQDNPMTQVPSQRFKHLDYSYDLISGKVNQVDYEKDSVDQWSHRYSYDADNRIKLVETSSSYLTWDRDAKYFYYEHGPLARMEIGTNNVQGIDYVYTLQGWLKGINSTTLDSTRDVGQDGYAVSVNSQFAPDAYSYSLGYYQNDYSPVSTAKWVATSRFVSDPASSQMMGSRDDLFNGNITFMMTSIKNPMTGEKLPQGTAYKYDQLNRLMAERAFNNMNFTANKWQTGTTYNNMYFNAFTYDANGNIITQKRYDNNNTQVEGLTYQYFRNANGKEIQNRLYMVDDGVASNLFSDDIDDQGTLYNNSDSVNIKNNYSYTELGELKKDVQEQIASIVWRTDGKIKEISRTAGSAKKNLKFNYDPTGNRIAKHIYSSSNLWESSTFYIRDVQGNIMATYEKTSNNSMLSYKVTERHIYGSSRLGIYTEKLEMIGTTANSTYLTHLLGKRQYEGINHLGNVLIVFSDRKFPQNNGGLVGGFKAEIFVSQDYYPFGVTMMGRSYNSDQYDFGFNGQMKVDEVSGSGNHNTAIFWEYDTRLGRRWNLDPKPTVGLNNYSTFQSNPILNNDYLGDSTNFKNAAGIVTKHVDDGSNAEFTLHGSALNQHYEFSGFDESQGGKNVVNLITAIKGAQELNDNNPSLAPDGNTYCNYATQNIIKTVQSGTTYQGGENNQLPISGMANSMVIAFDQSPVLKKYEYQNASIAINAAQQGNLVLIGYYNPNPPPNNHGHVASFTVGGNYHSGTVANVGSNNGFLNLTSYYYRLPKNQRVFSREIFKQVNFYVLQNIEPKVGPPIICNMSDK